MTTSFNSDERPWDLRLIEWMSRSSSTAPDQKHGWNPYFAIYFTLMYLLFAVSTGKELWYGLAIAMALLGSVKFAWVRSKRKRADIAP